MVVLVIRMALVSVLVVLNNALVSYMAWMMPEVLRVCHEIMQLLSICELSSQLPDGLSSLRLVF